MNGSERMSMVVRKNVNESSEDNDVRSRRKMREKREIDGYTSSKTVVTFPLQTVTILRRKNIDQ